MIFIEDAMMKGVKSPFDYKYVKLLRAILRSVLYWPGDSFGEKCPKLLVYKGILPIVFNTLVLLSNIAYLVTHTDDMVFLEMGHMYITIFLTILSMSRSMILPLNQNYKNLLVQYFTKVHLFYHANKSEYAESVHIQMHKASHIITVVLFIQMVCGLLLFNLISIYANYTSGKFNYRVLENTTYELAVFLYYPKDATTNRNSYCYATVFNWFASYQCTVIICMIDILLYLMVFHIYGHFKILLNLIATFPRPAAINVDGKSAIFNEMFSEEECEEIVNVKLKECIDYHKYLVEFTNNMSTTFGPVLFIYFAFHQVSCCLLLLECSQMTTEALIRYGPLTLVIFQELIQISVIFEIIGTASEKLRDAIYDMPWECMDLKNRKLVMFFLMNVQNPIHIKAMGMVDVGVVTMTTIVKTSVSFFAFLRTV